MSGKRLLIAIFSILILVSGKGKALTTQGTVISNTAVCTYVSPRGVEYTQLSNTVTTVVAQVFGVLVKPDSQEVEATSNSFVELPFTLENMGNGEDHFSIDTENLPGDDGDLQDVEIYYDENGNGKIDPGETPIRETGVLQPSQIISLVLKGKVPFATPGSIIKVKVKGRSFGDNTKEDSNNVYTVKIIEGGVLVLRKQSSKPEVKPDERFAYEIYFENRGEKTIKGVEIFTDFDNDGFSERRRGILIYDELPEGFVFSSLELNRNDWLVVYKGEGDSYWKESRDEINGELKYVGILSHENSKLLPSESGSFSIEGFVDPNYEGETLENKVYGVYSSNGERKNAESNIAVVNVKAVARVVADDTDDGNSYSGSGKPEDSDDLMVVSGVTSGSWVVFKNEVWNLGNRPDTINVVLDSSKSENVQGLTVKFTDENGIVLTDTNGDGILDVGLVPPGGKRTFYTKVFIPENFERSYSLLAIKGVSSINSEVYDYTYDRVENIENAEIVVRARVVTESGLVQKVVRNSRVVVYEYDTSGRLVRKKEFLTDNSGGVSLSPSGTPDSLYSWMRPGYVYRIGLKAKSEEFSYYPSPPVEKSYFDAVSKPGDRACWDWNRKKVDCSSKSAVVQISVSDTGVKTLVFPLDPAGFVYDAVSGRRINGACVRFYKCSDSSCSSYTLVDPSRLDFYPDGVTYQENPQVSGPTDNSGNDVELGDGDFVFQIRDFSSSDVGWYFITVNYDCSYPASDPTLGERYLPVNLNASSVWSPYSGKPYRGEKFYIDYSFPEAIALRIPLIPKGLKKLEVRKFTSSHTVFYGDLVKWRIEVKNPNTFDVYGVKVYDYLPQGFRYKEGSSQVDGRDFADPDVSSSGSVLTWNLGVVKAGEVKEISFYTYVTPGSKSGKRTNRAYAKGWIDSAEEVSISSNDAFAFVRVLPGVFTDRGFIIGRVFVDNNNNGILDGGEPGVAGVKIYMEDGRFVVTDSEGKFHFDNVKPGTHVLKVDRTTLPQNAILACVGNRNTGDPGSLFVDLFPGELFKANFRLVPLPAKVKSSVKSEKVSPVKINVKRGISAVLVDPKTNKLALKHCFCLINTTNMPLYEVTFRESSPFVPVDGTVKLDGAPFKNPERKGESFSWYLPVVEPQQEECLTWLSSPVSKDVDVKSVVIYSLKPYEGSKEEIVASVPVTFSVKAPKTYQITVYFDFGSYSLSEEAKESLKALADFLRKNGYSQIFVKIVGHTDSVRVSRDNRRYRSNKELSLKRAKAVEHYLRKLLIDTRKVKIDMKD